MDLEKLSDDQLVSHIVQYAAELQRRQTMMKRGALSSATDSKTHANVAVAAAAALSSSSLSSSSSYLPSTAQPENQSASLSSIRDTVRSSGADIFLRVGTSIITLELKCIIETWPGVLVYESCERGLVPVGRYTSATNHDISSVQLHICGSTIVFPLQFTDQSSFGTHNMCFVLKNGRYSVHFEKNKTREELSFRNVEVIDECTRDSGNDDSNDGDDDDDDELCDLE